MRIAVPVSNDRTAETLSGIEAGVISACPYGLKVLSNGTLTKKVTVKAAAFSESAKEKIEQAGA